MYINVAMNFNEYYNPRHKKHEEFKYKIAILCSKVILSVSPPMVKDVFQLQAYFEMQSYIKALKRYRPLVKIQTVLDAIRKQPNNKPLVQKKSAVIRDWFRLVLWYVRLRRACRSFKNRGDKFGEQGYYPTSLLRVNAEMLKRKGDATNPLKPGAGKPSLQTLVQRAAL